MDINTSEKPLTSEPPKSLDATEKKHIPYDVRDTIEVHTKEVLYKTLNLHPEASLPEKTFAELGIEEANFTMLILKVEAKLQIDITDEDSEKLTSPKDMIHYLRERFKPKNQTT